jgi:phosphoglucosamine mutase
MSKLASIRKNELSVLSTLSKDRKFGTDGIRGPVTSTMNPLFVTKLGWAAGVILKEEGMSKVLIGKDTRISGYMFESALQAGFISAGMDVTLLGPLPTPGVSYLANSNNQVGLVISASHNLFEDNGIKFFDKDGQKFSAELEKRIETKLTQEMVAVESINLGKASRMNDAQGRYIEFCKSSFTDLDLNGLSILLDCANGATYSVAPKVFSELGAKVETIGSSPDGININQNCGSTNPDFLKEELMKGSYDLGIAFDGDGDRILIVNSEGEILDGDDILYILSNNLVPNSGVVGTLMTNKALEIYFEKNGIPFSRAEVGDKYVLQRLMEESWVLGGEPSGHIICLDSAPTGDAIIAALNLLNAIKDNNFSIKKSLEGFQKFPQTLINLKVSNPNKIIISDKFWSEVTRIEKQLGQNGRVLIRPSGTEPLIRIMVESDRTGASNDFCNALADLAQTI